MGEPNTDWAQIMDRGEGLRLVCNAVSHSMNYYESYRDPNSLAEKQLRLIGFPDREFRNCSELRGSPAFPMVVDGWPSTEAVLQTDLIRSNVNYRIP